jgi:uncharacterized lipoprotein YddW (UPF0748 family)
VTINILPAFWCKLLRFALPMSMLRQFVEFYSRFHQFLEQQFPSQQVSVGRSNPADRRWRFKFRWRSLLAIFMVTLLLTIGLGQVPALVTAQTNRFDVRGVWMTVNDSDIWMDRANTQKAMSDLARLNFNTVYPVVWNSGYAMYPSPVAQQAQIQPHVPRGKQGQDTLSELIAYAHQQKLRVMPWMEFGFMAPPTSELAMQHPDWLTQQRDGNQYWTGVAGEVVWLNPFKPEVQQLITGLVTEIASRYDIDGIQFDDHLSLPVSFGYDPYTLALYTKETKKQAPANERDPAWLRWRADKITAFVAQLNKTVKALRPNAVFAVAPNPYISAYGSHLQDWIGWVRKNLVDELTVQVYRPDINVFQAELLKPEIQESRQKIPTGIGILTGLRNRKIPIAQVQSQSQVARSQGLGLTFFYYESLWDYGPEPIQDRQARFQALLRQPTLQSNL